MPELTITLWALQPGGAGHIVRSSFVPGLLSTDCGMAWRDRDPVAAVGAPCKRCASVVDTAGWLGDYRLYEAPERLVGVEPVDLDAVLASGGDDA